MILCFYFIVTCFSNYCDSKNDGHITKSWMSCSSTGLEFRDDVLFVYNKSNIILDNIDVDVQIGKEGEVTSLQTLTVIRSKFIPIDIVISKEDYHLSKYLEHQPITIILEGNSISSSFFSSSDESRIPIVMKIEDTNGIRPDAVNFDESFTSRHPVTIEENINIHIQNSQRSDLVGCYYTHTFKGESECGISGIKSGHSYKVFIGNDLNRYYYCSGSEIELFNGVKVDKIETREYDSSIRTLSKSNLTVTDDLYIHGINFNITDVTFDVSSEESDVKFAMFDAQLFIEDVHIDSPTVLDGTIQISTVHVYDYPLILNSKNVVIGEVDNVEDIDIDSKKDYISQYKNIISKIKKIEEK